MAERRRGGLEPLRAGPAGSVDRRRQVVALAWVGGLVLVVLVLWAVAVVSSSDSARVGEATALPGDAPTEDRSNAVPPGADGTTGAEDASGGTEAGADMLAPGDGGADTDDDTGDEEADDGNLASITFDGVCTVDVPAVDRDAQRPWQHEACTYAPVDLKGGERFIVVRASLPPAQVDAAEAEQRAADADPDARVLWSSHYPSLNRGFWVVFEGPFTDIDTARDAAAARGAGAYVRSLTDAS